MNTNIIDSVEVNSKGEGTISGSLAHKLWRKFDMDNLALLNYMGVSGRGRRKAVVCKLEGGQWISKGRAFDLNHAKDLARMLVNAGHSASDLLIVAKV